VSTSVFCGDVVTPWMSEYVLVHQHGRLCTRVNCVSRGVSKGYCGRSVEVHIYILKYIQDDPCYQHSQSVV